LSPLLRRPALPEGHTIHRLARDLKAVLGTGRLRASTLQERFGAGAARIDGGHLLRTDAWGKHLFAAIQPADTTSKDEIAWLHVHLGLYGKFPVAKGEAPPPAGQLRLRLETEAGWADLRGATVCELLDADARGILLSRLGQDPLRKDADPLLPWARISRSSVAIGALLMQQEVLAGVGNVYRAEILFRHGLDPFRPGRELTQEAWLALWDDLVVLMKAGVRAGRIVTTRPEDRPAGRRGSRVRREDSFYVYRRAGLPCRHCGTPVLTAPMAARNLFWCAKDQQD
jgi:endonuclease VIII